MSGPRAVASPFWALPLAAALAGGLRSPSWAAGALLSLWLAASLQPKRPVFDRGPERAWWAWAAWLAVCAFMSPEPLVSAPSAARAAACALVFAVARAWSEREADFWTVGLAAAGGAAGGAALATGALAVAGGTSLAEMGVTMTGLLPPYYNYSAFLVSAAAAAALACALSSRRPAGSRKAWTLACAFLLVPLLLSRSRGAQLGFLAAGAVLVARLGGRKAAWALGVAALGALFAIGAKFSASNQRRPAIWRAAVAVAAEAPLFGVGPERFASGFDRHNFESGVGLARHQMSTLRAHSEPLEAAATAGVPGLVLWLAVAAWPLALAARRPCGPGSREAALAAATAMTAQLLVDNMLQLPGLALVWAASLGAASGGEDARPAGGGWKIFAYVAAVASLAAFVPASALHGGERRWEAGLSVEQRVELSAQALRLSPASAEWRERRGMALLEAGDADGGAAELRRALELRPFRPFPAFELARLSASRGRWDEVLAHVDAALAAEPDFLSARLLRARALLAHRRRAEALGELREAARRRADLERRSAGAWLTPYDRALLAWDENTHLGPSGKIR